MALNPIPDVNEMTSSNALVLWIISPKIDDSTEMSRSVCLTHPEIAIAREKSNVVGDCMAVRKKRPKATSSSIVSTDC